MLLDMLSLPLGNCGGMLVIRFLRLIRSAGQEAVCTGRQKKWCALCHYMMCDFVLFFNLR